MKHSVESITSDAPARQELLRFLAHFEDEKRGETFWQKRLAFWWDENPASSRELPKGWALRSDGKITGFLGLIPFEYIHGEKTYRAFAATTWRVDKEHRNASLPMFMKWHALGREFILLDTTANAEVAKILDKFQYRSVRTVRKYFFPMCGGRGLKGLMLKSVSLLNRWSLPKRDLRIVKLTDSFQVKQSSATPFLRQRISREYLAWFCNSPDAPKEFIGCMDENGVLTSYLILQPEKYGERNVLSVIDYFTTRSGDTELLALISRVISHRRETPLSETGNGNFSFLMVNVLGEETFLKTKPHGVFLRMNSARHFYSLPKSLEGVTKHCVMAEGDYAC